MFTARSISRRMSWVYSVALIVSLLLSACNAAFVSTEPMVGQVFPLTHAVTELHALRTLAGASNGFILQNVDGTKFMFFWPLRENQGTAFWGVDIKSMSMMTRSNLFRFISMQVGQVGNCMETACLVDWMKSQGWKIVDAATVAVEARAAITTIITTPARSLPTFIVLPANTNGLLLEDLYPEPIIQ